MLGLGPLEIVIIVAILVLLFGAKKIPQLAQAAGETVRNTRRSLRELHSGADDDNNEDPHGNREEDT